MTVVEIETYRLSCEECADLEEQYHNETVAQQRTAAHYDLRGHRVSYERDVITASGGEDRA